MDFVVTGTVAAHGAGPERPVAARVETQVLRAGSATPLWSGATEWVAGDTAALRAGLTRVIAGAVSAVVTSREQDRLDRGAQVNANADEAYLRGRSELNGYGPEAARRALDAFNRATSFDPAYAAAFAWKSWAYVVLGQFGTISEGESRQQALAAAREARAARRRAGGCAPGPGGSGLLLRLGLGRRRT